MTNENNDDNVQVLNKRNTTTVQQSLLFLQERVYEQAKQIDGLNSTIQTLISRMVNLETLVVIQKAKLTGLGPTVKE